MQPVLSIARYRLIMTEFLHFEHPLELAIGWRVGKSEDGAKSACKEQQVWRMRFGKIMNKTFDIFGARRIRSENSYHKTSFCCPCCCLENHGTKTANAGSHKVYHIPVLGPVCSLGFPWKCSRKPGAGDSERDKHGKRNTKEKWMMIWKASSTQMTQKVRVPLVFKFFWAKY